MNEQACYPTDADDLESLVEEISSSSGLIPDLAKIAADYVSYHPDTVLPRTTLRSYVVHDVPLKSFPCVLYAFCHDVWGQDMRKLACYDTEIQIYRNGMTSDGFLPCPASRSMCTRCPISALTLSWVIDMGDYDALEGRRFTARLPGTPVTLLLQMWGGAWGAESYVEDGSLCIVDKEKQTVELRHRNTQTFIQFDPLLVNALHVYGSLLPIAEWDARKHAERLISRLRMQDMKPIK
jgi:hypothetical protein